MNNLWLAKTNIKYKNKTYFPKPKFKALEIKKLYRAVSNTRANYSFKKSFLSLLNYCFNLKDGSLEKDERPSAVSSHPLQLGTAHVGFH